MTKKFADCKRRLWVVIRAGGGEQVLTRQPTRDPHYSKALKEAQEWLRVNGIP